uniref:Uncharacterized protein n=1 Tax=Arundo donax TaxID=35708 RepID=A0A0A9GYT2_ARUDO
MMTPMTFQLE